MKVLSYLYKDHEIKKQLHNEPDFSSANCQLVIGFGSKYLLAKNNFHDTLHKQYPNAIIALCSTAGEIYNNEVLDDSLSVCAVEFAKTPIKAACINIAECTSSFEAGVALIKKLDNNDLRYVFVLSDGGLVNGSELVRGIQSLINQRIPVTGGMAGDGSNFKETLVGLNQNLKPGNIVAIGFYGSAIQIGHGSMGGWETFGLEKTITKSCSNELFEIDHKNALDIYKDYLGKYADELPSSALLFPLSLQTPGSRETLVRTILSINQEKKSMVFAGDVPVGSKVRFMKANFDKLIDAANDAAHLSTEFTELKNPALALLISCVGRKLILGKRVDEEVDAVKDIFPANTIITGFYSYGEISPLNYSNQCELHNQTMTITTFNELTQ